MYFMDLKLIAPLKRLDIDCFGHSANREVDLFWLRLCVKSKHVFRLVE